MGRLLININFAGSDHGIAIAANTGRGEQHSLRDLGCVLAILAAISSAAQAAAPLLGQYLSRAEPSELFAGADRFGPIQDRVPVAPVLQGDKLLGYAYLNSDFVNTTGYSGRPIHVLVGLGTDARVAGAKLVDHHEPIVLIGIPAERINRFIAGYVGQSVIELASQSSSSPPVDIVSGATVTVMVIGDSIVRSGRKVAQALSLAGAGAKAAQSRRVLDPTRARSRTGRRWWATVRSAVWP